MGFWDSFRGGTDRPFFENDDVQIDVNWEDYDAFPFGYWENEYGSLEFSIGDNESMHSNACGKIARKYFISAFEEYSSNDASILRDELDDIVETFENDTYKWDSDEGAYVSEDGTDVISISSLVDDIKDKLEYFSYDEDYIEKLVTNACAYRETEYEYDIEEHFNNLCEEKADEYDWDTSNGIDNALRNIGLRFDDYYENGRLEGRIWTDSKVISFYEGQEPTPEELEQICRFLSDSEKINVSYNELYDDFYIVFPLNGDYEQITACTVHQYCIGDFGDDEEGDEHEDNNESNYPNPNDRKGAVFIPHLANQRDKRDFFKDFIRDRDKNIYAPIERKYGSLAAYHAQKYQEEIEKVVTSVLNETVEKKKLLEYHHAVGGSLETDADEILKIVLDMYKIDLVDYSNQLPTASGYRRIYRSNNFRRPILIFLSDKLNCCMYNASNNAIYISTSRIKDALMSRDHSKLKQAIFHELGHMVNYTKADTASVLRHDFKMPLFLGNSEDEYERLSHVLYRFQGCEMRARCFETRMFLKNHVGNIPSLQEVYDNRCSDITLMSNFIDELRQIAKDGENSKNASIMKSLSRDTWAKNRWLGGRASRRWDIICKNTIRYFEYRLNWLKKRVDKIYSDFKLGYQDDNGEGQ